jgi:hypothetical protein
VCPSVCADYVEVNLGIKMFHQPIQVLYNAKEELQGLLAVGH